MKQCKRNNAQKGKKIAYLKAKRSAYQIAATYRLIVSEEYL